jgi:serine/threonine protein kinase
VPSRLPPRLAQQHDWDVDMFLGKGAYAVVLALRPNPRRPDAARFGRRAVKVVEKQPLGIRGMIGQLTNEVQLHAELHHPHIIRVLDQEETHQHVYMVLELATRTLRAWAEKWPQGRVPERSTVPKFIQVTSAVKYCHDHGVCHRDLTLGNILLVPGGSEGEEICKLADFGWACRTTEVPQAPCGSVESWAPEIIRLAVNIPNHIGPEVDFWALGVMLYSLLVGAAPFQGSMNDPRFIATVCSAFFVYPAGVVISERMHELIKRLLAVDPSQRLGPGELGKALEDMGPRPSPRATPSTSAGSSGGSSPLSSSAARRPPVDSRQRRATPA